MTFLILSEYQVPIVRYIGMPTCCDVALGLEEGFSWVAWLVVRGSWTLFRWGYPWLNPLSLLSNQESMFSPALSHYQFNGTVYSDYPNLNAEIQDMVRSPRWYFRSYHSASEREWSWSASFVLVACLRCSDINRWCAPEDQRAESLWYWSLLKECSLRK